MKKNFKLDKLYPLIVGVNIYDNTNTRSERRPAEKPEVSSVLKYIFPYILISLLIVSLVGVLVFNEHRTQLFKSIESEEIIHVDKTARWIEKSLKLVYTDLYLIRETLSGYTLDEIRSENIKSSLQKKLVNFSNSKKYYDQVRFIDSSGMETIRVNQSPIGAKLVPEDQLQDKGKRYYFTDIYRLNSGEVFVSPLDLNIEHGEIEIPYKPMLRIGTPIYNKDEKIGIALLNFIPHEILDAFGRIYTGTGEFNYYLVNSDGYQLSGPDPEKSWTFMFPDNKNISFASEYKEAWDLIRNNPNTQFLSKDGIFTSTTVYPISKGMLSASGSPLPFQPSKNTLFENEFMWKVVSFYPKNYFSFYGGETLKRMIWLLSGLIVTIFIMSYYLSYNIIANQKLIAKVQNNESILEKTVELKTHDLNERIKELKCLYSISNVIQENNRNLGKIFKKSSTIISDGHLYPEKTITKITYDGETYLSGTLNNPGKSLKEDILVNGIINGCVEVTLEEGIDFLPEEKDLINNIAKRFGSMIERINSGLERERALEEREQAMKLKDRFIGNISHEIRTPLNSILGFCKVINNEIKPKASSEHKSYFNIIEQEGLRLDRTVQNIINISQISTGTVQCDKRHHDLTETLQGIFLNYLPIAKNRGLEFFFNNHIDGPGYIMADKYLILTAISSLVDNAIKFTESGAITISLERKDNRLVLNIQDTGVGMDKDFQESLYSMFTQESSGSNRKYQGLGLGTTIAKYFLDMNDASISFESHPKKGTLFKITFLEQTPSKQI